MAIEQVTRYYFYFFFNAFISFNTTFFHLGIVRASCIDLKISTQEMLVVKVQKEEDKPLYNTKWDMGRMVQDLKPYLRAIGKSRFLKAT